MCFPVDELSTTIYGMILTTAYFSILYVANLLLLHIWAVLGFPIDRLLESNETLTCLAWFLSLGRAGCSVFSSSSLYPLAFGWRPRELHKGWCVFKKLS